MANVRRLRADAAQRAQERGCVGIGGANGFEVEAPGAAVEPNRGEMIAGKKGRRARRQAERLVRAAPFGKGAVGERREDKPPAGAKQPEQAQQRLLRALEPLDGKARADEIEGAARAFGLLAIEQGEAKARIAGEAQPAPRDHRRRDVRHQPVRIGKRPADRRREQPGPATDLQHAGPRRKREDAARDLGGDLPLHHGMVVIGGGGIERFADPLLDRTAHHAVTGAAASASSRRSTSSSLWVERSARRSRLDPGGTVGGRIAAARIPACSSPRLAASAASGSPSTTGTMCVVEAPRSYPRSRSARRTCSPRAASRARSASMDGMRSSAASIAPRSAGGGAVEKTKPPHALTR